MIRSFASRDTEEVWRGRVSGTFPPEIQDLARRKLRMLNAATRWDDLRLPPGNRPERLRGDREGQCSIRINRQWRICFIWREGEAREVEITKHYE